MLPRVLAFTLVRRSAGQDAASVCRTFANSSFGVRKSSVGAAFSQTDVREPKTAPMTDRQDSVFESFAKMKCDDGVHEKILLDAQFAALCDAIDKNCHKASPAVLHKCIANSIALGLPADTRVVACLENELLWNLRKCKFRFLVQIAPFYAELQRSDMERRLYSELKTSIQRRWVEIDSLKDAWKLFACENFGEEFLAHLEDRCIELSATAAPQDLQKTLCTLAVTKRRPGPLLRALAYHLARQEMTLTPRQLADLLSALYTLSFPDHPLIDRISAELKLKLPDTGSLPVVRSVLVSVGLLRWRNTGLIDSLCELLAASKEQLKPSDRVSALHTLAVINYLPQGVEDFLLTDILEKESLDALPVASAVTSVWAAVLLQKATSDSVRNLLKRISTDITSVDPSKMSSILQFAKLGKIPVPDKISAFVEKHASQRRASSSKESFCSSIVQALTHLVPKPKYLKEPSKLACGTQLDAEFLVNEEFEPVPLESKSESAAKSRRVAVCCWSYPDYCQGSDELTGYASFVKRCCVQSGCLVLEVTHKEFNATDKLVTKVQFLQKKLKSMKPSSSAFSSGKT